MASGKLASLASCRDHPQVFRVPSLTLVEPGVTLGRPMHAESTAAVIRLIALGGGPGTMRKRRPLTVNATGVVLSLVFPFSCSRPRRTK